MEQQKLWDHIQTQQASKFSGSTARLAYLVSKLPRHGKTLDIGVGGGQFEAEALAAGCDVYGIDSSEGTIQRLSKELNLGDKVKVGGVQAIPFPDEFFDCVVMSEVLEHLEDDILAKGLVEVRRVLKTGGKFIGTVPSCEDLSESMVYCPTCNATFHRWGHVRSFSPETLRATLAPNFTVRDIHQKVFTSWKQLNWRGKVSGLLQVTRAAVGDIPRGANIVFSVEK